MSQKLDNNVLDFVKQTGFYSHEYISDFEKFNEKLPSKEKFYSSLTDRKISGKESEHVINVWRQLEMKMMKDYHKFIFYY